MNLLLSRHRYSQYTSMLTDFTATTRAHVRSVHLKPWCCGCGARFGASTKLNRHLPKCLIKLPNGFKYVGQRMKVLNDQLRGAKCTEQLSQHLLRDGVPIYDYLDALDPRADGPFCLCLDDGFAMVR